MNGKIGADPADLARLAAQMRDSASTLTGITKSLGAQIGSSPWRGPSADRFRADWNRVYTGQLFAAAARLRDADELLRHNSEQQLQASASDGGPAATYAEFNLPIELLRAFGGRDTDVGATQMAGFLALAAPGMLKALDIADLVHGLPGLLKDGRLLGNSSAIRSSLGLGGVPAANWFKVAGGKVPVVGSALVLADVVLNWRQNGLYHEDTYKAAGLGGLGLGATFVAGPLGGLAFTAGTTIGQVITDHTQIDETIAGAAWSLAYGEKPVVVEDPPANFYQSASAAEVSEYNQRLNEASAEASRIAERTSKPWLFASDLVGGAVSRAKVW